MNGFQVLRTGIYHNVLILEKLCENQLIKSRVLIQTTCQLFIITFKFLSILLGFPSYSYVLAELRYVDARFRPRLSIGIVVALLALLGVLALVRLAFIGGLAEAGTSQVLEIAILLGLVLVAMPTLLRRGLSGVVIGAIALVPLALGLVRAPATTLVLLALLHNLTPVGFLLERADASERPRLGLALAGAFVVVPLLIVMGIPASMLGIAELDLAALGAAGAERHLGVFVPRPWLDADFARGLFAAAVYLQCLHYFVVLQVMPQLVSDAAAARGALLSWPSRRVFARILLLITPIVVVGFLISFVDARRIYGVFAALHAFVEVPILLLATTLPASSDPNRGLIHA